MNEPRPNSPRSRLQELLAIPERQRTDAEWDEINELEITLASQSPEKTAQHGMRRAVAAPPPGHRKPGGRPQGKKPGKKFHRKPPRGNAP
ncbi:MAG: hypothetical protein HYU75_17765 [Betaproteobacteria bacterium]|nr:hypothetical protein [Betaproteobacteria bacterium]